VSSVIYRQWQDPEYRNRVLDLIEQIEAGNKYVSMECVFSGFDYAVIAPNDTYHILARNDETAFLTQHLRAYGGTGAYQDHQVGRLLRNITFSGKGFVDKPANHESIIFDKNKTFEFNKASISSKSSIFNQNGVILKVDNPNILNIQESYNMSNEILNDQVAELKASLESVEAENKSLTDKLAEANVEKYEQSIKEQSEQLAVRAEQIETLTTELETAKTSVSELTTSFEVAKSERDVLAGEIAEMCAMEKARSRQTALIEAGLSDAEAKAKIETFENLSDEQFDTLVQTISTYIKVSETEVKSETDVVVSADETIPETVDEEVLETVKAEESVQLSVESDAVIDTDKDLDVVRAGLNDWVQTVILNTNNSKSGE
jgi:predicted XRE-type DNA-binding protein